MTKLSGLLSICLLTTVCLVTAPLSMGQAQVTLTVEDGGGYAGSSENPVEVVLNNPSEKVKAVMLEVCDVDDYLFCTGCETTERSAGFICAVTEKEDGCVEVVLFVFGNGLIEEGNGPIFFLNFDVSPSAPLGECREVYTENEGIANQNNLPLDVSSAPGDFCFAGCSADADCDDGLYCSGAESCDENSECQPGTPVECPDDGLYCNGDESCGEGAGYCVSSGNPCNLENCNEETDTCGGCAGDADCDDGLYCSGDEICDENSECQPGTPVECPDDGLYCNGDESCGEGAGYCVSSGNPCNLENCNEETDTCGGCAGDADCDDGLYCSGDEICDENSECQPGTPVECPDDGLYCNGDESCGEGAGSCVSSGNPCRAGTTCNEVDDRCDTSTTTTRPPNPVPQCTVDDDCDDGLYCTGNAICVNGRCQYDELPCAPELCDEDSRTCADCSEDEDCDDGIACTDDTCDGGTCENRPNDSKCPDDGIYCNGTELCDVNEGCSSTGDPCEDLDVCDEGNDLCVSPASIKVSFSGLGGSPFLVLPGVVTIQGTETDFTLSSIVDYDPGCKMLECQLIKLPMLLFPAQQTIIQLIFTMPSILPGAEPYPVNVTVRVDEHSDDFEIPALVQ